MKMRAAILTGPGRLEVQEVEAPEPGPRQLRVRLEGCGVCGSNLPPYEGRPWFKYPFPAGAPGHEGWGVVEAAGREVRGMLGARVAALSFNAYAEYDLVEAQAVVQLPAALEGQPFPGEALGCAINVFGRSEVHPGSTVAVVGVGFLGAVVVSLAASTGARVIALSRRPFARLLAEELGATHSFSTEDPGAIEQVKALTGGQGVEVVVEAAGLQSSLDLASALTRIRGRLVIAGYHQDGDRRVNLEQWNWRGLDVINAHERDPARYVEGMRGAVEAILEGRLRPWPLYTHRFALSEVGRAFEAMRARPDGFLKALVMSP